MPGIIQEKFQVDNPQERNDDAVGRGWISQKSVRVTKGLNAGPSVLQHFNSLPPGMDLEDQEVTDQHAFKTVMSGQSDVSRDYNGESIRDGERRLRMRGTDDEYSNAHVDAFYDEITIEGDTGFAERNNVLDRL